MHVVVLSTDPADGNPRAWGRALEHAGATAEVLLGCRKRRTHRAWDRAGLAQPRTWALGDLAPPARWPSGPALVKPAFGESARGIALVTGHRAALAAAVDWPDTAIVQEVVACRSVLRVHATADRVLGAFARPAAAIDGLPDPDPVERAAEITEELAALSTGAGRALGGGLIGLDVIRSERGPLLLEANATFLVPVHLPGLLERIARATLTH